MLRRLHLGAAGGPALFVLWGRRGVRRRQASFQLPGEAASAPLELREERRGRGGVGGGDGTPGGEPRVGRMRVTVLGVFFAWIHLRGSFDVGFVHEGTIFRRSAIRLPAS